MALGIVTDSTAYLAQDFIDRNQIKVIPIQVVIDGKAHADSPEISVAELVSALRAGKSVTTARPGVQNFTEAYQELINAGVTEILSIHISGKLSGTYESAVMARKQFEIPIAVLDSKGVAGFLALSVIEAAKLRASNQSLSNIEVELQDSIANRKMYFYVDTLEFLQKGGRVSSLRSKVGQLFTVKPILKMENGQVELHELVRTEAKAVKRLVELATQEKSANSYLINHVAAAARAAQVAQELTAKNPAAEFLVSEVGAVVAAHVGPGAVSVVVN